MRFVLDTSAIIAFLDNEDGCEQVSKILLDIADNKVEGYCSVVTLIEVYYVTWRQLGEQIAAQRVSRIKDMKLEICDLNETSVYTIGKIKFGNTMSFADCCVASVALEKNAILLHKDPEFEQLGGLVQQQILPYKEKKKN